MVVMWAIRPMQQAWPDKRDISVQGTWNTVMENFMQHYKNVVGTISKSYPNTIETVIHLKKQEIKQAVVTNKEQPYTSKILAQQHMQGFFNVVISGNSLPYKKPNPIVVEYCLEA